MNLNTDPLTNAFLAATAHGIKHPKLHLAQFTFKPAKPTSSNPGAIYVTEGETYLGKVMAGQFLPMRSACSPERATQIVDVLRDPHAAAIAHGKKYGHCAVCRRELSDPESVERGIGPVCADRMGWTL